MKHIIKFNCTAILGIAFLFSVGCSNISTPELTLAPISAPLLMIDGQGRQINLSAPAQRIVSLAPSNTEILFAVGAGKQVVGRDSFSDYPEDANSIPDIGGGFGELNLEVILALKPDLVLAGDLTPPEQVKSLEQVGIPVFVVPNPKDFPNLFEIILSVAKLTGHESEAEPLTSDLDARLQVVDKKIRQASTKPLVFYEIDGTDPNAPWTPGPGSFIDMLIQKAGGINLGSTLESEWAQISIEELIIKDPDLIIIGDAVWGGVTPESVRARPGWETLSAIQNDKLYVFDDNLVSRPGPRMLDGLEGLAKLFHPELFP